MTYREVDVPASSRRALEALSILSNKWHPAVLVAFDHHGPMGFNELKAAIPGVSGKVLSGTLDALQEGGLIERTVLNESPLRVEYELTDAGRDMTAVFEALASWADRHLEATTPTVLLADDDRRITDMYGQWLEDRYAVHRADDREALDERLRDDVDVVVLDERLPAADLGDALARITDAHRAILLVGDRPGVELLELQCDDVLRKPVVSSSLVDAIDGQLARRGEPPEPRERAALRAKLSMLESVHAPDALEADEDYLGARSRLAELEE